MIEKLNSEIKAYQPWRESIEGDLSVLKQQQRDDLMSSEGCFFPLSRSTCLTLWSPHRAKVIWMHHLPALVRLSPSRSHGHNRLRSGF
jgi:hypothetical protein